ncbi:hypothetical protein CSPX01_02083, partial [Colletotrichum filicis]
IIAPSKNRLSVTSTITTITISPQNLLLSVPCKNAFSKSKPVSVPFATPACPDQAILTDMMDGYSGPCHNIPYVGHRVVHKSHAFVSRPAPQVQESPTLVVPILPARPQQSSSSLIAPLARLQTLPTQVGTFGLRSLRSTPWIRLLPGLFVAYCCMIELPCSMPCLASLIWTGPPLFQWHILRLLSPKSSLRIISLTEPPPPFTSSSDTTSAVAQPTNPPPPPPGGHVAFDYGFGYKPS